MAIHSNNIANYSPQTLNNGFRNGGLFGMAALRNGRPTPTNGWAVATTASGLYRIFNFDSIFLTHSNVVKCSYRYARLSTSGTWLTIP